MFGETRYYDLRGVRNGDGLALTWRDVTDRQPRGAGARGLAARSYRLLGGERVGLRAARSAAGGGIAWASPSMTRAARVRASRSCVGRKAVVASCTPTTSPLTVRRERRARPRGRTVHDRDRCCVARTGRTGGTSSPCARCSDSDGGVVTSRISSWRDVDAEVAGQEARARRRRCSATAMQSALDRDGARRPATGRFRVVNDAMCRLRRPGRGVAARAPLPGARAPGRPRGSAGRPRRR